MSSIVAISRERHGTRRWKRPTGYPFAAAEAVVPLTINELPRAAMAFPVAFASQDDQFVPAAVLALTPGQNLLVGAEGRWKGQYTPALFRAYPFLLATAGDSEVLCIDEASGLLTDAPDDEPFFDETGPSKSIAEMMSFLQECRSHRVTTQQVCAVLRQHGLIQPWPITLMTRTGEQSVNGLFRIDEAALNNLPAEVFLEVRVAGGLLVAYCQLLSMHHMTGLGQLAALRAETEALKGNLWPGEPGSEYVTDSPLMDFSNLK